MWIIGRDASFESYEFVLDNICIAKMLKTYPHEGSYSYYGFVISDKYKKEFMGGETRENLMFKMIIRLKEYGWNIKGVPFGVNS